jgi:hypothetical protein
MNIKCKDGDLQVPEILLQFNPGARKFCNSPSCIEWAKGQRMTDVFSKLNDMPWD